MNARVCLIAALWMIGGVSLCFGQRVSFSKDDSSVKATGFVEAANYVDIRSPLQSVILDIVPTGNVSKGDVLFMLDTRPLRIAAARAKAEIGLVENEIRGYKGAYQMEMSKLGMAQQDLSFFSREYEGPGVTRQEIPASRLTHGDAGTLGAQKPFMSAGRKKVDRYFLYIQRVNTQTLDGIEHDQNAPRMSLLDKPANVQAKAARVTHPADGNQTR